MVHVAHDHFVNQLRTNFVVVEMMPAGEFVQNVKAEFVAQIQKLFVRRIVRHTNGIHVRVLHRVDVEQLNRLAQGATGIRPEGMTIRAFQNNFVAVDVKSVTVMDFKRAESETLSDLVKHFSILLQTDFNAVKIGSFCRPQFWRGDLRLQRNFFTRDFLFENCSDIFPGKRLDLRLNLIGIGDAIEKNISGKVWVSFVVEKDGQLSNINIDRGIGYGTEQEAIRVLKMAKAWKPGKQNGQFVRVKYNLPLSFVLNQ